MAPDTKRLFDEACALPEDERVRLAERLLATVDDGSAEEIATAWAGELDRRARELDAGTVRPVPWTEVKTQLRQARERA
jgi:putative addiction module component (TIGR02574 family)